MMADNVPLWRLPGGISTRWASPENWRGEKGRACSGNDGRKRSPCFCLPAGESRTLAEVEGKSGIVRRMWMTIMDRSPRSLRGLRLDCFWDGAEAPAISAPVGDFFCHGLGQMTAFENALFACPEARSFNCYLPMPFRTGMKIVLANESGIDQMQVYYDIDYTLGDAHGPDDLYCHAHWRRESPTTLGRDFEILPRVSGRGRYLGANVSVIVDANTYFKTWWGEGEVKIYLDGDTDHPTLCGTGTEDYIGTGWGQGRYANSFQGCPVADAEHHQYAFYRLHVPDPVYFSRDVRVTLQQIGCWGPETIPQLRDTRRELFHGEERLDLAAKAAEAVAGGQPNRRGDVVVPKGYGIFERRDDVASCAWFYLDRPANGLPALAQASVRIN